jgi:hypothetical protein
MSHQFPAKHITRNVRHRVVCELWPHAWRRVHPDPYLPTFAPAECRWHSFLRIFLRYHQNTKVSKASKACMAQI